LRDLPITLENEYFYAVTVTHDPASRDATIRLYLEGGRAPDVESERSLIHERRVQRDVLGTCNHYIGIRIWRNTVVTVTPIRIVESPNPTCLPHDTMSSIEQPDGMPVSFWHRGTHKMGAPTRCHPLADIASLITGSARSAMTRARS